MLFNTSVVQSSPNVCHSFGASFKCLFKSFSDFLGAARGEKLGGRSSEGEARREEFGGRSSEGGARREELQLPELQLPELQLPELQLTQWS